MSRTASEIRKWQIGSLVIKGKCRDELFFAEPVQPTGRLGVDYLRDADEQRVIVETEIAAQLAELNENMKKLLETLGSIATRML